MAPTDPSCHASENCRCQFSQRSQHRTQKRFTRAHVCIPVDSIAHGGVINSLKAAQELLEQRNNSIHFDVRFYIPKHCVKDEFQCSCSHHLGCLERECANIKIFGTQNLLVCFSSLPSGYQELIKNRVFVFLFMGSTDCHHNRFRS